MLLIGWYRVSIVSFIFFRDFIENTSCFKSRNIRMDICCIHLIATEILHDLATSAVLVGMLSEEGKNKQNSFVAHLGFSVNSVLGC